MQLRLTLLVIYKLLHVSFDIAKVGNGEIFYGKRKYNPSGKVDADYNGGGFSDWRKMEAAREFREERARMKEEAKEKAASEK